ncbi:MAG: acetyl-CoA C-acetyltransferase [Fusobacteria bacterium]|nr:acetyl-CoA C-acetyltransferase [Fusobacteriota bacterium]
MSKVYICAAKRTAIGAFLGTLAPVEPKKLAEIVMTNVIDEAKIDPSIVDEVVFGNVLVAGHSQNPIRQAAIISKVPQEVPAYGISMVCGSGMKAITVGYKSIRSGGEHIILAGGLESMSRSAYTLPATIRNGNKFGDMKLVDTMLMDGLTDGMEGFHMGITAENIAIKYNITREEQDAFAVESQNKAQAAIANGSFKKEIVPVEVVGRKETIIFDTDEHPKAGTTIEKLGKLKPAFKKDGSVTAGNSSGLNDGASCVLLASETAVKKYKLSPMAEIIGIGQAGVDPHFMGIGPVPAVLKALKNAGLSIEEIDIFELNEAFAAQSIAVVTELAKQTGVTKEWLKARINPNGGAIALGHPIGASGNRVTVTLVHELITRKKKYGIASLCIGGGMGIALVLKNSTL